MYQVTMLQILRNQVPRKAMVYFIEQGNMAMPLNEIEENGYEIVTSYIQANECYLIVKNK